MGKKSAGTVVGYELGNRYSQISFCGLDGGEPETVSAVMGTEQYNIPTVLCKKQGVNQWYYGKEALKYAEQEDGILLADLYHLAMTGEAVMVDGESFDPAALLSLFVKRSLSLLSMEIKTDTIAAIMFTVAELNRRTVEVFGQVAAGLELAPEKVYFQSFSESIYQYVMHQPKELWSHQVLLFDYSSQMQAYLLESNRKTTPLAVFVQKQEFPRLRLTALPTETVKQEWDREFLAIVSELCRERLISSVFLVGEGFKEEWLGESLKFLCRGRRVFQGTNLYSKGACYGASEKCRPSELAATQVFLGEDKLKSNIGMKILRQGSDSYFAVLDAGANWYELKNQYELILPEGNELSFIITSLTGGIVTEQIIALTGLPERPPRTTRLRLQIRMLSVNQAQVTATDLGFGDLFPASGKEWVQELTVP